MTNKIILEKPHVSASDDLSEFIKKIEKKPYLDVNVFDKKKYFKAKLIAFLVLKGKCMKVKVYPLSSNEISFDLSNSNSKKISGDMVVFDLAGFLEKELPVNRFLKMSEEDVNQTIIILAEVIINKIIIFCQN